MWTKDAINLLKEKLVQTEACIQFQHLLDQSKWNKMTFLCLLGWWRMPSTYWKKVAQTKACILFHHQFDQSEWNNTTLVCPRQLECSLIDIYMCSIITGRQPYDLHKTQIWPPITCFVLTVWWVTWSSSIAYSFYKQIFIYWHIKIKIIMY